MADSEFNIITELNMLSEESKPSVDDSLNNLRTTNWEVLDYFRTTYISQSEQAQALKSELIELDVKIEELEKTRDIYSFQSDTNRSVFSPIQAPTNTNSKSSVIQAQIHELQDVRRGLISKIEALDTALAQIRHHIQSLESANQSLASLYHSLPQTTEEETVEETATTEETETTTVDDETMHACKILMFQQYDKCQVAGRIKANITEGLENNQNKLEVLKWLIQSDPTRARLTLQELQDSNERLLKASQKLIRGLNRSLTHQLPIWKAIDECVQSYRTLHPDCTIELSVDCPDYDIQVMPIITITVLQLLQSVLDNTFYYSNANKVLIKIYVSSRMIDVYINDNGAGIPADHMTASSWHSGLHRLSEIIHLFDGKLQIDGDMVSGTNVRFSFPILVETKEN